MLFILGTSMKLIEKLNMAFKVHTESDESITYKLLDIKLLFD